MVTLKADPPKNEDMVLCDITEWLTGLLGRLSVNWQGNWIFLAFISLSLSLLFSIPAHSIANCWQVLVTFSLGHWNKLLNEFVSFFPSGRKATRRDFASWFNWWKWPSRFNGRYLLVRFHFSGLICHVRKRKRSRIVLIFLCRLGNSMERGCWYRHRLSKWGKVRHWQDPNWSLCPSWNLEIMRSEKLDQVSERILTCLFDTGHSKL